MNVLEKILEEIEHESKLAHEEMRRCASKNPLQFDEVKGYARGVEYTVDIIRSHMDEAKDTNVPSNDGWIDCKKSMPTKDMDKKPVWIVYGSPMNLSVKFAYCEWTLSEDEYENDDSCTQFYIPQAPCSYYPSSNLVHYWKPVDIPNFSEGVRK